MSRPADLLKSRLSVLNLIRFLLEPVVIIATLVVVVLAKGEQFDGAFFILSLLVFSLTFPGNWYVHAGWFKFLRGVVLGWLVIVAILLFVGWATKMLTVFPTDCMLAFFAATPVALQVAHEIARIAVPRVLAHDASLGRAIVHEADQRQPVHAVAADARREPLAERVGAHHDRAPQARIAREHARDRNPRYFMRDQQ